MMVPKGIEVLLCSLALILSVAEARSRRNPICNEEQQKKPKGIHNGKEGWTIEDDGRPLPAGVSRLFNINQSLAQKKNTVMEGKQSFW